MNLKYYLRGLGIGILVTALIMSIATGGKEKLSNEEIMERARALGMVPEGTLLEDAKAALNTLEDSEAEGKDESEEPQDLEEDGTPEVLPEPSGNEEPKETPGQSENEEPEESALQSETSEPEDDGEPPKTPEPEVIIETEGIWQPDEADVNDESITVQVMRGDGSYTVCKRLEEAGIVSSASEFDTFLCQNGYDKRIRAGTFEIPGNASPEQIARILSGS